MLGPFRCVKVFVLEHFCRSLPTVHVLRTGQDNCPCIKSVTFGLVVDGIVKGGIREQRTPVLPVRDPTRGPDGEGRIRKVVLVLSHVVGLESRLL